MADNRERNQGMKRDSGGRHAPGRNPQDDRSAGQRGQREGIQHQQPSRKNDFDPSRGGDGGNYKQGRKNDQNTRR